VTLFLFRVAELIVALWSMRKIAVRLGNYSRSRPAAPACCSTPQKIASRRGRSRTHMRRRPCAISPFRIKRPMC